MKQPSKVRAGAAKPQQPALTVETVTRLSEAQTLDALFGDDGKRLAFKSNDPGLYVGYLTSGQLARFDASGVHIVTIKNTVGTLAMLFTTGDGWEGGNAFERWLTDLQAALPEQS